MLVSLRMTRIRDTKISILKNKQTISRQGFNPDGNIQTIISNILKFYIMKKQLLFAAAMFVSIAASAQTVVYPCTSTSEDGKKATAVNNDATIEGSTSIEAATISWGSGVLEPST